MPAETFPADSNRELVLTEDAALPAARGFPLRLAIAKTAWLCLAGGLGLTLIQVCLMLWWAPDWDVHSRYLTLVQHDSFWFGNIMERGFQSPVPPSPVKLYEVSNVAFFPGYPLAARFVQALTGMETVDALIVTAQLAAWLFWSYLLAFLRRWRVPWIVGLGGSLLVMAHPAALFMVVGYSESLFMAMLLGFLFWTSSRSPYAPGLAMLHGLGTTATRIVGLPCVVTNLVDRGVRALFGGKGSSLAERISGFGRAHWPQLVVSGVSMLGGLSFFAFCQWKFGHWNFYMQTQFAGWGVKPDYLAFFKPETYAQMYPDWKDGQDLSQFSVPMTIMLMIALAGWEAILAVRKLPTKFLQRLPLYFAGALIFYVSVCGVFEVELQSMIRYQFCTHVLLVLAVMQLLAQPALNNRRLHYVSGALALLLSALFFYAQRFHASEFMIGGWVA